MNNRGEDKNEKPNLKNTEKQDKLKSDYKVNRIHRISPDNNINIKLFDSEKQSEEEKERKIKSARHLSASFKNNRKEINEELHKEEVEKEKEKRKNIFTDFVKIYAAMRNKIYLIESNSKDHNDIIKNENEPSKKENLYYYIINKSWLNQFKNYAKNTQITYSNINIDYPGQINNQHLILEDDNSLKLNSEKRIIINSKYIDNCTAINEELWNFLVKICGGGPEIKYILKNRGNNDIGENEIEVIKKAVHINLLFVPKKEIISNNNNKEPSNNINNPLNPFQCHDIKKILINNNETKNKYGIEHIYFDISKSVQELVNYINKILNQHRNKFINTPIYFGPNFNSEKNNCLVDNINYRLWLNNIETNPINISNFINNQISKYEDIDFLMKFSQMDKFDMINDKTFTPYLLSNFIDNKIEDIFPNKYTKNFQRINYAKYEDENFFPTITIIIEEYPYHFEEPTKKLFIKKCNYCGYKGITSYGCFCEKVFYCSNSCQKKDNHIYSCKKGLYHFISQQNEELYKKTSEKKEYFEKNKNERQTFPNLGLTNLGNSCYMNSSLQCLFSIKELTNYFLYFFKEENLNKENVLGTGGILTCAYINLLLRIINDTSNNKYITPEIFKILLGLCSKKYEGNEQEDAHEFINYLLDILHEDLNRVINKPTIDHNCNDAYINNIYLSDEEKSMVDWNTFLKRNQSVLIDLFYGQYKSCVICPKCNFKSVNFNSFLSLELPINENNNNVVITVCFIGNLKESPYVYFNVILKKSELRIFVLRKKIANLLEIDLLEFELAFISSNNEIIHIFEINEDIPSGVNWFYAFRINPQYFYSYNNDRINDIRHNKNNENENINEFGNENYEEKFKIDYQQLEAKINKRKNEIIDFNENTNINADYLYFSLKYNDNLGLNTAYYQRCILQSVIVKKGKLKNFESDEIIYLEKNKKCNEIYFDIFYKYVANVALHNLNNEQKNKFFEIYKSGSLVKKNKAIMQIFSHFFKNAVINPSKLDLINHFPDIPFILFLKNKKYNIMEAIPFSSHIDYNEILTRFNDKINIKTNNDKELEQIQRSLELFRKRDTENDAQNQEHNPNIFADIITNILSNNGVADNGHTNNTSNNNPNNYNSGNNNNKGKNGLPGGGHNHPKNTQNENEENEEESSSSSGTETNNDNNSNNENSEHDTDSFQIEDDISDYSNSNGGTKGKIDNDEENDNDENDIFFNNIKPTAKDENMDRILIAWNGKYIKRINRFKEINLCDICDKIYEKSPNVEIPIEKCFEEFSKEEKLDKENLWYCPNCNENLPANKKIEIYNVPKILIIHLKRFNNNKKINTFIKFPLKNLDIGNHINKKNKETNKYDLFGVVNHHGSLEYGHYTAFCKNYHDHKWYEYNDRIVKKIPPENEEDIIVNKFAYVLFYREQKNDSIIWEKIYKKEFVNITESNMKKFGEDFIYEQIEKNETLENIDKNNNENKLDLDYDVNISQTINENEANQENAGNAIDMKDDYDNFSFKEGANNLIEKEEKNDGNQNNGNITYNGMQTPKFNFNKKNRIQEDLNKSVIINNNNKNIFDNLHQSSNDKNDLISNSVGNCNNDIKYNTQIKEKIFNERFTIYNTLAKSKDNIIRITTYKKIRKNKNNPKTASENKNTDKIPEKNVKNNIPSNNSANGNSNNLIKNMVNVKNNNTSNNSNNSSNGNCDNPIKNMVNDKDNSPSNNPVNNGNNIIKDNNLGSDSINEGNNKDNEINLTSMKKEQDLLEYDIFNQNKNYFKVNKKKDNKPYISVKSKELINFLLKEYSDNVSDKVPRSKKLYDESNLSTENKANSHFIFNNNQKNKEKRNEETIIAIKEDGSDNLKYVNKIEFDLEDFVYNPFRDCYAKIRKF